MSRFEQSFSIEPQIDYLTELRFYIDGSEINHVFLIICEKFSYFLSVDHRFLNLTESRSKLLNFGFSGLEMLL